MRRRTVISWAQSTEWVKKPRGISENFTERATFAARAARLSRKPAAIRTRCWLRISTCRKSKPSARPGNFSATGARNRTVKSLEPIRAAKQATKPRMPQTNSNARQGPTHDHNSKDCFYAQRRGGAQAQGIHLAVGDQLLPEPVGCGPRLDAIFVGRRGEQISGFFRRHRDHRSRSLQPESNGKNQSAD